MTSFLRTWFIFRRITRKGVIKVPLTPLMFETLECTSVYRILPGVHRLPLRFCSVRLCCLYYRPGDVSAVGLTGGVSSFVPNRRSTPAAHRRLYSTAIVVGVVSIISTSSIRRRQDEESKVRQ